MKKERLFFLGLLCLLFVFQVSALDLNSLSANQTILSKHISIPEPVQSIFGFLFQLPQGNIVNLQQVILLSVLFFAVLIIINSVITLVPFFQGRYVGLLASLIITLLTSISGGLYASFTFLNTLSYTLTSLNNLTNTGFLVSIGIVILVCIVFLVVMKFIKGVLSKEQAHAVGFKMGKDIAETKLYSSIFKKSLGNSDY